MLEIRMLVGHGLTMDGEDPPANEPGAAGQGRAGLMAAALAQPLAGFFRRRLGGGENAEVEDLVQEVFVRASGQLALEDPEHVRAYVFRVAATVWIDRYRRRQSHAADLHVSFDPERHDQPGPDPAFQLDARETLRAATEALATLPERTRSIFILRRIEGLAVRQIADRLGLSTSAVEKHTVKAFEHLLAHTRISR